MCSFHIKVEYNYSLSLRWKFPNTTYEDWICVQWRGFNGSTGDTLLHVCLFCGKCDIHFCLQSTKTIKQEIEKRLKLLSWRIRTRIRIISDQVPDQIRSNQDQNYNQDRDQDRDQNHNSDHSITFYFVYIFFLHLYFWLFYVLIFYIFICLSSFCVRVLLEAAWEQRISLSAAACQ